jgi:Restriction endonuclease
MIDDVASDEDALPEDPAEMLLGSVKFDRLSPTDFEEFCHDLMSETGFTNVDWRKGTPKESSPADRGRDIVAELERRDVDGHRFRERWFVDCKHYGRGVPPEALQGTIAWATAERPDVVLFIASGYFTNGAKDWLATLQSNKPPFRLRTWEMPHLRRLLAGKLDLAFKHEIETAALRRVSEIISVERELFDKLWYGRSQAAATDERPANYTEEIWRGAQAAARRAEGQYGRDELLSHTETQFAWGMLSGKIAAIRWVLGDEWDNLDS